mmetsp:Transcript_59398/g.70815  ORF Transcript_59398/g.70815 Transcript_59398/m.70815 type:complete len:167 (+) Transcript_59398:74-574(+)
MKVIKIFDVIKVEREIQIVSVSVLFLYAANNATPRLKHSTAAVVVSMTHVIKSKRHVNFVATSIETDDAVIVRYTLFDASCIQRQWHHQRHSRRSCRSFHVEMKRIRQKWNWGGHSIAGPNDGATYLRATHAIRNTNTRLTCFSPPCDSAPSPPTTTTITIQGGRR